ncbi:ferritin-like domain-containing protein [Edaphobacter flagellatus]|uniref:ferritin-like domain-containing protein n=1 Tax=Edaphobacter flagellatus TaxID=1933044 RepID=UPI0021B4BCE7|nr:ferritin-like domain-containing protein [Edaphobacter flagellatus]
MATQETQQLDAIISSRRALLAAGGAALAGLALASKAQAQTTVTDNDILNFALNLEYLEAQFYTLATAGVTIDKLATPIPVAVNGGTAGTVTLKPSFAKVPFSNSGIASYAAETALEEQKHVKFLQSALGTSAVSMPNIDLYNSFNALASGAGIGSVFDPFASDANFLIGAYIFEDVGVSAYHGAAGLISDKTKILPAAVGIHAVEAYHAGLIRTTIAGLDAQAGNTALSGLTQKISAFRAKLANPSGTPVDDVGVGTVSVALNGSNNNYMASTIVNADSNTVGWSRTTTQILAIVTGGSTKNAGVFFPSGLNGTIK